MKFIKMFIKVLNTVLFLIALMILLAAGEGMTVVVFFAALLTLLVTLFVDIFFKLNCTTGVCRAIFGPSRYENRGYGRHYHHHYYH